MEPIKIKKRARTIPFGFKQSEDPNYLEPIKEELDALNQAKEYLKTCSLRETASWLHRKTGRYISHVGLKKRISRTSETQEEESIQSEGIDKEDS
jgi:hypothetical protein